MIHYFHLVGIAQMIFCVFYLGIKVFVGTCFALLALWIFPSCCKEILWELRNIHRTLDYWRPR